MSRRRHRTRPLALSLGLTALSAAACTDAAGPSGPAAAPSAPTQAVLASRTDFLAQVEVRFQGWSDGGYGGYGYGDACPAGTGDFGCLPAAGDLERARLFAQQAFPAAGTGSCLAAQRLAGLTTRHFAYQTLAGQPNNPTNTTLPGVVDAATDIVETALVKACGANAQPSFVNIPPLKDAFENGLVVFVRAGDGLVPGRPTKNGQAAITVPPGTFPQDALLVVAPITDPAKIAQINARTQLPKSPPYYEFTTVPYFATLNQEPIVEIVQSDPNSILSENVVLVHVPGNPPGNLIEALDPAPPLVFGPEGVSRAAGAADGPFSAPLLSRSVSTLSTIKSPVRSGSASSLSPFFGVLAYSATFPRATLNARYCGLNLDGTKRVRLVNGSTQEAIVSYLPLVGTTVGERKSQYLTTGPSTADVKIPGNATSMRLLYGPFAVRTINTAGAPATSGCN